MDDLIYLSLKSGGMLGIRVSEIARLEDLTEDSEREARKTAQAITGRADAQPSATAGGTRINGGQHQVKETVAEIRDYIEGVRAAATRH